MEVEGGKVVMRLGCDGGWNGGDGSHTKSFGSKFRMPVTRVYGGGEWPLGRTLGGESGN
jgi:hypothetical protein